MDAGEGDALDEEGAAWLGAADLDRDEAAASWCIQLHARIVILQ